jgi:hypothetical protein
MAAVLFYIKNIVFLLKNNIFNFIQPKNSTYNYYTIDNPSLAIVM